MEQKHILLSALGVGVGVGLGLVSGQTVSKWSSTQINGSFDGISDEQIEQELLRLIIDGKQSSVTFGNFPYYLR